MPHPQTPRADDTAPSSGQSQQSERSDPAGRSAGGASGGSGRSGVGDGKAREHFAADELAIVLSHFDLGTIEWIKEFPRGSRKAPKLLLRTENGTYLLKRRARGKDDPFKVAFCHQLQLYLAAKQFPLPHLIGTRTENNSMLQFRGATYELFAYVKGTNDGKS